MSLRIIKAGILDTIQDNGRYGYQHLGINPGGTMDGFSAAVTNMLVGNDPNEAVIEMHFPASTVLFEDPALIAIGGAEFSAAVDGEAIPNGQPVIISRNSILQFQKRQSGAIAYLAVGEKFSVEKWLNSFSTNLQARVGGFSGRPLQKDDTIEFREKTNYELFLKGSPYLVLPWKANYQWFDPEDTVAILAGNEFEWLTEESRQRFLGEALTVGKLSDRMGYRLNGYFSPATTEELVSSAVNFGTVQLLPNGELIVLMADHQTTGGYPRIAHVASAHLPAIAQKQVGEEIRFRMINIHEAEHLLARRNQHLLQLQNACNFRLDEFFSKGDHRS